VEGEQLGFFVDMMDVDAATAESASVTLAIQTQLNQIGIQTMRRPVVYCISR